MRACQLAIIYAPPGERAAVDLVHVANQDLLLASARQAISDQERWAARVAAQDSGLGRIEQAEARRLRETLESFIPELGAAQKS